MPKIVNLALQGGGAHGAFAWGVLDRLLVSGIKPAAISGTSAGAVNAVLIASGWQSGGIEGARQKMEAFWMKVALNSPSEVLGSQLPDHQVTSMTGWVLDMLRYISPYDLNPLDINPLRSLLEEIVDFEKLRANAPFALFIAATDVSTGKIKIFRETELSVDHILASACLPTIHQAIEIKGRHYWDGGFSGNPAIYPLIFDCKEEDILLLLLQPIHEREVPTTSSTINQRVTELGFQSAFLREMRAVSYTRQQAKAKYFAFSALERRFRALRFHMVESGEVLSSLEQASKYDTRQAFLLELKAQGQVMAERWLKENFDALGKRPSCDIEAIFL